MLSIIYIFLNPLKGHQVWNWLMINDGKIPQIYKWNIIFTKYEIDIVTVMKKLLDWY